MSRHNLPLSWGWNAFPRKFNFKENQVTQEDKYRWIVHAEMNAIYNSSRESVCLRNSTIYIHGIPPCVDCAKAIVQVGILRVVYTAYGDINQKWLDSFQHSRFLFNDVGVTCVQYTTE